MNVKLNDLVKSSVGIMDGWNGWKLIIIYLRDIKITVVQQHCELDLRLKTKREM